MVFDGPVCLTRFAPSDAYADQLVFYDVVDPSIYSRSGFLSSIVEAGGEVILPDIVTLREFKTWLRAVNTDGTELRKWSFSSMCSLLKAADVLGDACVDAWIRIAASALPVESRSSWLATKSRAEDASQGIDKLSAVLQRRLFAAAVTTSVHLCNLLDFLPSKHHAAVLEATITDTQSLKVPLRRSVHAAQALSFIPASPPSFSSLNVHDLDPERPLVDGPGCPEGQQLPSCLAQALHHHSALISLQMTLPCITSSNFKQLSPAIAALKSLQSLLLDTNIGPDSLPTLQQTLAALPTLQQLSISFFLSANWQKRLRDEEGAGLPQYCMSAMLSAATALTSLDLSTVYDGENLTATSPVSLPHLSRLAVRFACDHISAAADLLSHLSAPLTSLDVHHNEPHRLALSPTAMPDVQRFFTNLTKFTELQSLALASPHDSHPADHALLDAISAAAPTTLAALPQLSSLRISCELSVLQLIISSLATRQAQLTELDLSVSSRASAGGWGAWPAFLQQLSTSALQRLKITVPYEDTAASELPGLVALPPLPHVTAVYVNAWACLKTDADLTALARMTQLEKLHLLGMRLPVELREGCARCLGALSALTSLQFRSATEEGSISRVLDRQVPQDALDDLQELSLDAWFPSNSIEDVMDRGHRIDEIGHIERIVSSAGEFTLRRPAIARLDIYFEKRDSTQASDDRLRDCLDAISDESAMLIEVSCEGKLPF